MCAVERFGASVCIRVVVSGSPEVTCPVVNYGGVGMVLAPQTPWSIRKELKEFPGLLQMVRAYDARIVCLKLSAES